MPKTNDKRLSRTGLPGVGGRVAHGAVRLFLVFACLFLSFQDVFAQDDVYAKNLISLYSEKLGANVKVLAAWQLPHENGIESIAISPDEDRILSGGRDGSLKLWNLKDGKLICDMKGHKSWVTTAALSPDGESILSGDRDGALKLWNLKGCSEIWSVKVHPSLIYDVAFSPDSRFALTGSSDESFKFVDLKKGKVVWAGKESLWNRFSYPAGVNSVAFSADGLLAFANGAKEILVWDVKAGRKVKTLAHEHHVSALALSRDGNFLLLGGLDHKLALWDYRLGKRIWLFYGHHGKIDKIGFMPDGKHVVSVSLEEGSAKVWDLATQQQITQVDFSAVKNKANYYGIGKFSSDGHHLFLEVDEGVIVELEIVGAA